MQAAAVYESVYANRRAVAEAIADAVGAATVLAPREGGNNTAARS